MPSSTTDPYQLIQAMLDGSKPYLVLALEQDMAGAMGREELVQTLKEVEAKLAGAAHSDFTAGERFIVQYAMMQHHLLQMRSDGAEHLGLDIDAMDKLSAAELQAAMQAEQVPPPSPQVLDIRSRLPKPSDPAALAAQRQQLQGTELEDEEASMPALQLSLSVREFDLTLTQFLNFYQQLQVDKAELLRYEKERLALMREYKMTDLQVEQLYTARPRPSSPSPSLAAANKKVASEQPRFFSRLKALDTKRNALVARMALLMDDMDRFYRYRLSLEQRLQLKALLKQMSLGTVPRLRLQNVLKPALAPAPRPGMGRKKKPEEIYQPRPRPTTPKPSPL